MDSASPPYRELGVDAAGASIVVVDGKAISAEDWTQWDDKFKRPHAIYISPYDAQSVWVVDDHTHAITSSPATAKQLVRN
jgi:hypothetical protein